MERRFHCTACGKCCHGWVPLTLDDALAHAGRFPLAMVWTPVRQGSKAYKLTAKLGTTMRLGLNRRIAVQVAPTAYIPPALPCPELAADGLCAIHADKPLRCRTMPFSPYREERDQTEDLIPRPGWLCDTSAAAPVVYRDRKIVAPADFERERQALVAQAPVLRAYAEALIAAAPNVAAALEQAAAKKRGGHVALAFSAVLPRLPDVDRTGFARRQLPVLRAFAARTQDDPALADYHRFYRDGAAGLERYLERAGG